MALYKRQYNDKTLYITLRKIYEYMRASGANELRKCSHFHILKLLFPLIFCWYYLILVSEIYMYIFSGLKLHLHTYIINAFSFIYYVWYGAMYKRTVYRQNTNIVKIYAYASGASGTSELRILCNFTYESAIPFSICWYFIYFVGDNWPWLSAC